MYDQLGLTFMQVLGVSSAVIIFVIAVTLVLHRDYDDGLIGKLALSGLVIATLGPLWEHFHAGIRYNLLQTTLLLYVSIALFLMRHVWRFNRYLKCGAFSWSSSNIQRRRIAREAKGETKKRPSYFNMGKQIVWTALVIAGLYLITEGGW